MLHELRASGLVRQVTAVTHRIGMKSTIVTANNFQRHEVDR